MKKREYDKMMKSLEAQLAHTRKYVSGDYGEGMLNGLHLARMLIKDTFEKGKK